MKDSARKPTQLSPIYHSRTLGQQGHNLITAELYAAKQLADHVAPNAATP